MPRSSTLVVEKLELKKKNNKKLRDAKSQGVVTVIEQLEGVERVCLCFVLTVIVMCFFLHDTVCLLLHCLIPIILSLFATVVILLRNNLLISRPPEYAW